MNRTTYSVVIQLFKDLLRSLSLKSDIAHQKIILIFYESRSYLILNCNSFTI